MKRLNIRNIIVPIDFSKMSVQAIQIARQLARRFGASIHLAHVRHLIMQRTLWHQRCPFAFMTYEQIGEQTALEELKKVASECGVSSATCDVLSGAPPFDEICRLAQTVPADLVVMPTHGRTGLKHVFLGSTAERIVQHSSCPVLVSRGSAVQANNGSRFRIKPFLSRSTFPIAHGKVFATRLRSRMNLGPRSFCCTRLIWIRLFEEGTAIYDIPGLQKAARKTAERKMRELVRSVNFGAVKFETVFTEGSPVLDICAFAKDHAVDLIITSTHGFTGFTHVLIGSIAEQVVRHAPCSVFVVPSHPHVRAANVAKSADAKVNSVVRQRQSPNVPRGKAVTRKDRKLATHAFPERRRTNKFRESHSSQ